MPQTNICLKEFTAYSVIRFSVLVFHCYLIMLNQFSGGPRGCSQHCLPVVFYLRCPGQEVTPEKRLLQDCCTFLDKFIGKKHQL